MLTTIHGSSRTGVRATAGATTVMITAAIPMFTNEKARGLMPEFARKRRMYARLKP